MKPCPHCGGQLQDDSQFCRHCMTNLAGTAAVLIPPVTATRVSVIDVDMPFGSMVKFMIKWALAAIPAVIILFIVGAILAGILAGVAGT